MKFSRKVVANGPLNKCLNFSGDPDHRLDTGIVFRIRHHWDDGTGKTCLGGGMLCPSASR